MVENKNFAIEIKKISYSYTKSKKDQLLQNLDLKIEKNKWTTLLGPNASGKSTIAKLIVGILQPKKGSVYINHRSLKSYKIKNLAKQIAYVPQETVAPHGIKVYDFVAFGRNPYLNNFGILSKVDKAKIKESLIKTKTWEWRDRFLDQLSGGQKQKVIMALVLAQDTNLIIFDEPTTYLDIKNQYQFLEMIKLLRNEGKTIVTILHDINQAIAFSDEIILLQEGDVFAQGKPLKVLTTKIIKEVYGVNTVFHGDGIKKHIGEVFLDK